MDDLQSSMYRYVPCTISTTPISILPFTVMSCNTPFPRTESSTTSNRSSSFALSGALVGPRDSLYQIQRGSSSTSSDVLSYFQPHSHGSESRGGTRWDTPITRAELLSAFDQALALSHETSTTTGDLTFNQAKQ